MDLQKQLSRIDVKKPLPQYEEEILAFWRRERIFEKSIGTVPSEQDFAQRPLFSFYDGPPFATGLPHYGHLLAGTIKDVIPRYKTMQGYRVPRRFGWDCHGLPIENEIEKAHSLSGAASIEAFGIDRFNEECRSIVFRYTEEWKSIVERFGRWVDFENTYKTMDPSFMESVWWVFSELYKKGLIYKGYKVMPFSTKLGTPLSNFEAGENYKDVQDPSIVVKIELEATPNRALLIWTTTPWTLVSNLAVAVGPDIQYAIIGVEGEEFVIASERVDSLFPDKDSYTIIGTLQGSDLAGMRYIPLFGYFKPLEKEGVFQIIADSFVQIGDGTGLVHLAPGFGEDDFYACQKAHIPIVCPVDQNGSYTSEIPDFQGRYVKNCDKEIIALLKQKGKILRHETLLHRYPFCWRSDTPLIYKAVSTWFVAVEKIKEGLLKSNSAITWVPEHIKNGRFGKWLENARDWAISRNRYWGTPIPIWESDDGDRIVISSIEELYSYSGHQVGDLHRHFIDQTEIQKNGKVYKRIPEVFDCWFESGSMPYAQNHYPFESKELFETLFPADFIAEGLDQTRGWFYTLTVLSTALFGCEPFKNVIVNGIILAEDGTKMSKRLRNYPDPLHIINKYGADAVRLYMLSSPAVRADDLCFSEGGVELILRQVLLPLLNAYSFYVTYADLYGFNSDENASISSLSDELDRWIISKTGSFLAQVEDRLDTFDLQGAVQGFPLFIDMLTNWYIRRSRRRFWSEVDSQDRREAFSVLHAVLKAISQISAPFIPFFSEMMWSNLKGKKDPLSVHLSSFPKREDFLYEQDLEESHEIAQKIAKLTHGLRKEVKMRVRQPLQTLYVITNDLRLQIAIARVEKVLLEELNVKALEIQSDETAFVDVKIKPNFRSLGKKVGKRMKLVQDALLDLSSETLTAFLDKGPGAIFSLEIEGEMINLDQEDLVIEKSVKEGISAAHDGGLTIALDIHLTAELISEGLAREVINKVNTMRRDLNLEVFDRIKISLEVPSSFYGMLANWLSYIEQETVAHALKFTSNHLIHSQEWEMLNERCIISIQKAEDEE